MYLSYTKSVFAILVTSFLFDTAYTCCKNVENNHVLQVQYQYLGPFVTLTSWLNACKKLPKNRAGARASAHSGFAVCGDQEKQWLEFKQVLDAWLLGKQQGALSDKTLWYSVLGCRKKPDKNFFKIKSKNAQDSTFLKKRFVPFAQKVQAHAGDIFYIHGDLHGDISSLVSEIEALKNEGIINDDFVLCKPNVWLIFLGDYTDRGCYGCEVLYTLMRLSLANPDRVVLLRGNHEDLCVQARYGFSDEVAKKFGAQQQQVVYIALMYNFMPVVFYLGCSDDACVNYVQFCHGGLEERYHPARFLDDQASCFQLVTKRVQTYQSPKDIGFLWNDFDVLHEQQDYSKTSRRGFSYGKAGAMRVCLQQGSATSSIKAIVRGHQHSIDPADPMMQGLKASCGVYALWQPYQKQLLRKMQDGLVWIFNVAPDSIYGTQAQFNFDTYAALTVAKKYQDWSLQIFNT